jgi:Raf kinase inhibitor-like YbhB/YbcL family protein
MTFTLLSPDIVSDPNHLIGQKQVFNGFGCTGENISPALSWSGAPVETKSFALMMYDPDAPTGSGWWHWIVYNIPSSCAGLNAGVGTENSKYLPIGARQNLNDYGFKFYGGPCPPPNAPAHRYIFTLHALSAETLDIPDHAPGAMAGFFIHAHSIAKAELIGYYKR